MQDSTHRVIRGSNARGQFEQYLIIKGDSWESGDRVSEMQSRALQSEKVALKSGHVTKKLCGRAAFVNAF